MAFTCRLPSHSSPGPLEKAEVPAASLTQCRETHTPRNHQTLPFCLQCHSKEPFLTISDLGVGGGGGGRQQSRTCRGEESPLSLLYRDSLPMQGQLIPKQALT